MNKVVDKELISYMLMLETDQQEKVLAYIKELLESSKMSERAEVSEKAIANGEVKSFDQFNEDFETWKAKKRASIK